MEIYEILNQELGTKLLNNKEALSNNLLHDYDIPEKILDRYFDKYNTLAISMSQNLSEDFIETHFNLNIEYQYLISFQKLSENFMEKHREIFISSEHMGAVIDVSSNQELSEDFIRRYIGILSKYYICRSQKLSKSLIKDCLYKFIRDSEDSLHSLYRYQILDLDFIKELEGDGYVSKNIDKINPLTRLSKDELAEELIKHGYTKISDNYDFIGYTISNFSSSKRYGMGYHKVKLNIGEEKFINSSKISDGFYIASTFPVQNTYIHTNYIVKFNIDDIKSVHYLNCKKDLDMFVSKIIPIAKINKKTNGNKISYKE